MTMAKNFSWFRDSKRARRLRKNIAQDTNRRRTMRLEQLEQRQLLALGPNLVGVHLHNNAGELLLDGGVLHEAPRELVLQFSPGQSINAATLASGIQLTRAGLDAAFTPASIRSDFGTNNAVELEFTATRLGSDANGVQITLTGSKRGDMIGPGISVNGGVITVDLNTTPGSETKAQQLVDALNANASVTALLTASVRAHNAPNPATVDITPAVRDASEIATFNGVQFEFTSVAFGEAGNGVVLNFSKSDRGGVGPAVTVTGNVVDVVIDTNAAIGPNGTTGAQLRDTINALAGGVVQAVILNGLDTTDVSLAPPVLPLQLTLDGVKDVSPLVLNGANAAKADSSLGTAGAIEVEYTARVSGAAGNGISVVTTSANRGSNGGVGVTVTGNVVSVEVNTNPANRTTARQYVNAINAHPVASTLVLATLPIGIPETVVTGGGTAVLTGSNDVSITPGYINVGDNPNEVIIRFAETLPDDDYRLELYGVSSAASGTTDFRTISGDIDMTNDVQVRFVSREPGVAGNGRVVQVSKASLGVGAAATVSLAGNIILLRLNTTVGSETTAQGLQDAINNDATISALLTTEITGNPNANIAGPALPFTQLVLAGGYRLPLANSLGEAFNTAADLSRNFELNLAPQVVSVVPQPVDRSTQQVAVTGSPTGGSFALIYNGQPTDPITYASAASATPATREAAVRTALEGVVGVGNVSVTSAAPLTWDITFIGTLSGRPVGMFAGDATALTGSPTARVTVRQALQQANNRIDVYFNQDELDAASAQNRAFYRVTDTKATLDPTDDVILLPSSVAYDAVNNVATLLFASAIPDGTHHLTIGTSDESNDVLTPMPLIWGRCSTSPLADNDFWYTAFIGDNVPDLTADTTLASAQRRRPL